MAEHRSLIDALNAIAVAEGGTGGHRYMIDALNEWAVLLGGAGGHKYTIDALNVVAVQAGGQAGHRYDIDALNAISVALGGSGGSAEYLGALNVIADTGGGGGGEPEWLPSGAIAFMDFESGHFFAGGAEVSSAAMLTSTAFIQNGVGLVFSGTGETIGVIGAAKDFLLAGSFTVVFDIDATTNQTALPLIVNALDDSEELFYCNYTTTGGKRVVQVLDYAGATSRTLDTVFGQGTDPGSLKIAATRSDTVLSFSQNGAAVLTDTTVYGATPSAAQALIGGFTLGDAADDLILRSITIYNPKPDADLPALSSL